MQSTFGPQEAPKPCHVAIIMDGNGRWATRRGLPRPIGHRQGVEAVRRTVDAAPRLGITTLTLFAFSSDNWRRPETEVCALMSLLADYLGRETERLVASGVELRAVGRRDRLPSGLADAIAVAEQRTRGGKTLRLCVALDYSSRRAIADALVDMSRAGSFAHADLSCALRVHQDILPDVDLVIRTGGEKRLSDFLLWESAYAELFFTDVAWPDFGASDLAGAVDEFRSRDRRFGAAPKREPIGKLRSVEPAFAH